METMCDRWQAAQDCDNGMLTRMARWSEPISQMTESIGRTLLRGEKKIDFRCQPGSSRGEEHSNLVFLGNWDGREWPPAELLLTISLALYRTQS